MGKIEDVMIDYSKATKVNFSETCYNGDISFNFCYELHKGNWEEKLCNFCLFVLLRLVTFDNNHMLNRDNKNLLGVKLREVTKVP